MRRGAKLLAPEGRNTRPTTDRVKESMFAVIQFNVAGARVLDMFAGSGALGIEALSRGALNAVFYDISTDATNTISDNLAKLRLCDKAQVRRKDVLKNMEGIYDLIFIDPPYAENRYFEALCQIMSCGSLADNGIIIAESDNADIKLPRELEIFKQKKYGQTYVTYIRENKLV